MAFKSEDVSGRKMSKERERCFLCVSVAGKKTSLLVIGKYAMPWTFKRADMLPVKI
jgi:hypothetical protein